MERTTVGIPGFMDSQCVLEFSKVGHFAWLLVL